MDGYGLDELGRSRTQDGKVMLKMYKYCKEWTSRAEDEQVGLRVDK